MITWMLLDAGLLRIFQKMRDLSWKQRPDNVCFRDMDKMSLDTWYMIQLRGSLLEVETRYLQKIRR